MTAKIIDGNALAQTVRAETFTAPSLPTISTNRSKRAPCGSPTQVRTVTVSPGSVARR